MDNDLNLHEDLLLRHLKCVNDFNQYYRTPSAISFLFTIYVLAILLKSFYNWRKRGISTGLHLPNLAPPEVSH